LLYPDIKLADNDIGLIITGPRFFSYISDPFDTNLLFFDIGMDFYSTLADINITLRNYALGFPLSIQFTDSVDYTLPELERNMLLNVSASYRLPFPDVTKYISLAGYTAIGFSGKRYDTENKYAYTWGNLEFQGKIGAEIYLSNKQKFNWELFGNGATITSGYNYQLTHDSMRTEAAFELALEAPSRKFSWLGLDLAGYYVYDEKAMNILSRSDYFRPLVYGEGLTLTSYTNRTNADIFSLNWLIGAKAEVKLFSSEIQQNVSHIYSSRWYSTIAVKGGYWGNQLKDETGLKDAGDAAFSAQINLGADAVIVPLSVLQIGIKLKIFAGWNFSDGLWKSKGFFSSFTGNPGEDLFFGATFNMLY
jgi:hypothetical protein